MKTNTFHNEQEAEIWLKAVYAVLQGAGIDPRQTSENSRVEILLGAAGIADNVLEKYRLRNAQK